MQAAIWIGGLLAIGLVWTGLSYHLRLREDAIREQVHRDVLNLSISVEKHVERLLVGVDQVLRFMADDFARDPDAFDFPLWLQRSTSLDAVANQISMYDAAGEILASRTPLAPGMPRFDIRDRAYFRALAASADPGLYVDRTLRGRLTGRYVLQTARRLSRRDGSFAGVIVISINPDYLSDQFAALDVGRQGSVAMFGHDGYIRARYPKTDGMYEVNATTIGTGKGVFAHLKDSPVGTYEVESAFDHVPRIFGYRTVGSLPLVVTVGKSLDEVMAPFMEERSRARLAGFGVTALMLAALVMLSRALTQRHRRTQALTAVNLALGRQEEASRELNRLHAMAEHIARVGHFYVRLGDSVHRWSEEMYRIYDVDRHTFAPTTEILMPMVHPDDRERAALWWRRVYEDHQDNEDGEFRMVVPSGQTINVLVRSQIERNENGAAVAIFGALMDVTERRNAEAAVARTSALLSKTLDCMDQGLIMVDAALTVQVCNRRAAELLEMSPAFLAGHPSYGAFRAQARKASRWGALVEETPLSIGDNQERVEARAERRTVEGHVLEIRTIRTADGGMIQTFADITDQRATENRFKMLAENATDLIALKPSLNGRRSYVSPASRAIVGWEPEELAGLPSDRFIHPDDFDRVRAEFASLSPRNPRITSSHRARHKDGHYLWLEATFQLTQVGRPDEAVIVSARDVTARHAAEEALRESEARHRMLAEATSDVIAHVDLDGTLRYLSPAVTDVVGYRPEDLVGRSMTDFVHPDDLDGMCQRFRALVAAGSGARDKFAYRVRHRDGRAVWLEVNPTVIFDPRSGQPTGYIDVARDVTARKAAEAELEAARVAAEQASRAKSDFLASMSHEIRTPLNGVLGYTDLMLDDTTLTDAQRRQAERIRSAGSALLTIVNDILDFSKIEAGQIDLDPGPFHLAALLENAASIVRAPAERKGLALELKLDPDLPSWLLGDQNRLRQILLNLLNNAVKFTARGHVTLSVAKYRSLQNGCGLRFTVADSGIGIPIEKRSRLFERFSQVDNTIQRDFGGTGLGLAISKRLVELMGGAIGVESTEGQGSVFWFEVTLPMIERGRETIVPDFGASPAKPVRILLVEDVEINREIACAVLEAAGHEVDVASDGIEAIAAVQAKPYDLILMDVQMPGMDGITATRHIRALSPPLCDVPIIAMTANVLPTQVMAFRAAGMDDHIGKPFDRAALHALIRLWSHTQDAVEARRASFG